MKNKLLPLVFVLGCYSAYSQVGIGTNTPRSGAQLDVTSASRNKGILIPDVDLTSTTDTTTIKNKSGETTPESLLVFNKATVADVTPGYYYWYNNKWNRMINSADLAAISGGTSGISGIAGVDGAPGTAGAITTLDAIVKDPNGNIYAYVGSDNTVKGRNDEWQAKSPNWVKINGTNGKDGKDGVTGGKGEPGAAGTPAIDANTVMYIDQETGIIYVRDANHPDQWVPINGKDGKDGLPGAPGLAGGIGLPGADGNTPAAGISTWSFCTYMESN